MKRLMQYLPEFILAVTAIQYALDDRPISAAITISAAMICLRITLLKPNVVE